MMFRKNKTNSEKEAEIKKPGEAIYGKEKPDDIDREIESLLSAAPEEKSLKPKKKRNRKIKIIAVVAVAAVAVIGLRLMSAGRAAATLPETAELSRGNIESSLTITGPVEGTDRVDVTSNLHAKVLELNVKEGDRVTENETVLARLDTTDIEKRIEVARGNYELAVAKRDESLRDLQSQYDKAVQDLRTAEDDFNRKSALYQAGDISQVDYETASNTLNDARRAVNGFNAKNGKIVPEDSVEIEINNAALELKQAEDALDDAVIIAPISGTVTRVYTKVGQFADQPETDNAPMIIIENLDKLQMEIKISEYSIRNVAVGQEAEISADILGDETVKGEITDISPTGEEKGGGSTERVIPTTISIDNSSRLIAGITAKAKIVTDRAEDTFTVPISALGDDGNGGQLMQFVVAGADGRGTVKSVPVLTGIESDIDVEIKDILDEAAGSLLNEGQRYIVTYNPAAEGMSE